MKDKAQAKIRLITVLLETYLMKYNRQQKNMLNKTFLNNDQRDTEAVEVKTFKSVKDDGLSRHLRWGWV